MLWEEVSVLLQAFVWTVQAGCTVSAGHTPEVQAVQTLQAVPVLQVLWAAGIQAVCTVPAGYTPEVQAVQVLQAVPVLQVLWAADTSAVHRAVRAVKAAQMLQVASWAVPPSEQASEPEEAWVFRIVRRN